MKEFIFEISNKCDRELLIKSISELTHLKLSEQESESKDVDILYSFENAVPISQLKLSVKENSTNSKYMLFNNDVAIKKIITHLISMNSL